MAADGMGPGGPEPRTPNVPAEPAAPSPARRGFLKAGLATAGVAFGMVIPCHRNLPAGFVPAARARS